MLQRTPTKPAPQFTPVQLMVLQSLSRRAVRGPYGPAPYQGIPKGFAPYFQGQFADLRHKIPRGLYANDDRRVELMTYKSPIVVMVDMRSPKNRPPYNTSREQERRVNQGINEWKQ